MSIIQLGAPGALRKYVVKARGDGLMWGRGPANPFSAKVNSSNKYDEVDIWNEWVQEDWQAGVGRVDAEAGGFLYGEVDTRVPNQFILPTTVGYAPVRLAGSTTSYWGHMPSVATAYTTLTIGSGTSIERLAAKVTFDSAGGATEVLYIANVSFYALINPGVGITVRLAEDDSGSPSIVGQSATLTVANSTAHPSWYSGHLEFYYDYGAADTNAAFWAMIYPTSAANSLTLIGTASNASSATAKYASAAWSAHTTFFPFFHVAAGHQL